jgi:RNA polymerase II subunit A C-terminal domain phosphatase
VKVDAARKRGGIKIVWLAWFTDSVALWHRQDETPYLLDDPPVAVGLNSSPTVDYHQISSDPDTDDWDEDSDRAVAVGEPQSFELAQINWDDINDEVEAAMNESDDDDVRSEKSGTRSGNVSEDDWSEGTGSVVR